MPSAKGQPGLDGVAAAGLRQQLAKISQVDGERENQYTEHLKKSSLIIGWRVDQHLMVQAVQYG